MAGLSRYIRTVPAGQQSNISARGRTIVVYDVVGTAKISARSNHVGNKGGEVYTLELRKFEQWKCPEEFDIVEIDNTEGGSDLVISLLIGEGEFRREVTSRTSAPKFATALDFSLGNLPHGSETFFTVAAENLQRARALLSCSKLPAGFELSIGPTVRNNTQHGYLTATWVDGGGGDFSTTGDVIENQILDVNGATPYDFSIEVVANVLSVRIAGGFADFSPGAINVEIANASGEVRKFWEVSIADDGGDAVFECGDVTGFTEAGAVRVIAIQPNVLEGMFGAPLKEGGSFVFESTGVIVARVFVGIEYDPLTDRQTMRAGGIEFYYDA